MESLAITTNESWLKRPWSSEDCHSGTPSKRHRECSQSPGEDSPLSWSETPVSSLGAQIRGDSLSAPSPPSSLFLSTPIDLDLPDACSPRDVFPSAIDRLLLEVTPPDSESIACLDLETRMGDSPAIVTATFDETSTQFCPGGRDADSGEDSDVCYGLICDIKVEPRWVPPNYADKEFLEVPEEGQSFLALKFSFREDLCIIQTQEEEDVAMLNRKNFDAFHDLPEPVRLEGLVHKVEWADNIAAVEKCWIGE